MAKDNFDLLPESGPPSKHRRCPHLHKVFSTHPCLYGFMFISILMLDIATITNDALLFRDVSSTQQGLVFGPLSPDLVMALLLTSAVELLALLFEIFNIIRDICGGKPWIDLDLDSSFVVWLGEIPTIITNVRISICRSEPISYFQLTKAIILIVSVILRSVVPVIRSYLRTKSDRPITNLFRKIVFQHVTAAGLCVTLCGSISIFILTHMIATDEGKFKFSLPQEIWDGKVEFEKYFTNVGIYFHHTHLKSSTGDEVWLKLADMKEVYGADSLNVKVTYTVSNNMIDKLAINSYNATNERYQECYLLEKMPDGTIQYDFENCTSGFIAASSSTEKLVFKFVFQTPNSHLMLGDISFNAKYLKDFTCHNISTNDTNLYQNIGSTPHLLGNIMYMKQVTDLHATHRMVHKLTTVNKSGTSLLFEADTFLQAADDIWNTGIYGCGHTGKRAPSLDKGLAVIC